MKQISTIIDLKQINLLTTLSEEQITNLAGVTSIVHLSKHQNIYKANASIKSVYIVRKGSVKLGIDIDSGKTLIKNISYSGELFGENIFTSNSVRQEYAEAMEDSTVYVIPIQYFKTLAISNPFFGRTIAKLIIERLKSMEQRVENFVFKKAKRRIVDFIRKTGELRGIKIGIEECLINHGMSHKEIAFLTDTSRQTVARVLGELKRENLIYFTTRKPSKILIRNLNSLV